ncbi:two-component system, OmpR family, KDP operon response regulator KdpE [Austwickia chelonae]|uniref:Two-component response regulator KdpE n=1 Tax=Austwickia chelonae NBRC 105200 TaxID=1184607 RepID=K6VV46_9MICO|nr:response regulator transcription factor [Austwickia chelonae]GAB79210.1 two-component response regulator KdpE [Austwickia chelonae NBRC 105200]SEW37246.1 two-component system, OmpR family, KDP operon response regulator KdpE [Austwickia chelonae]
MTRILVVDDEPAIARTLRINLRARGYEPQIVGDGRSAMQAIAEDQPDLVILDLGLPDRDGIEVLAWLRRRSTVPVVVLSARHESDDKVEALDLGADDFVTKPFGMDELMARIRSALRRAHPETLAGQPAFTCADFVLDFAERRAADAAGTPIRLTPTEWRIVAVLAREPGHLVTQAELLAEVWGPTYRRESNYLRVFANQLRRKLEPEPSTPVHLITEPGQGYRLMP